MKLREGILIDSRMLRLGSETKMEPLKKSHRYAIAIFALLGLGIMGYLTYIHYANARSFCDISAEISCDVVTASIYSEIFGVPVSLLGIFYFAAVLIRSLVQPYRKTFRFIFMLTIFVLMPSLYLSAMEYFSIKAFCILCESSKVLMLAILFVSWTIIRWHTRNIRRLAAPLIISGIVIAVIIYFVQTGTIVKRDYSPLTSYLTEQGWVYYRSYTCSNCKKQEKLLGEAYKKLKSVECHPKGPGGNPELCLQKRISKTPTWLLEKERQEVKRLEGFQPIENLIEASGFTGLLK